MLDWMNPEEQAKQQARKKRELLWMRVKFVLSTFFLTFMVCLCSNAPGCTDSPWIGTSYLDRHGNLVMEPYWPGTLLVSFILAIVAAGIALAVCLRRDRHEKT